MMLSDLEDRLEDLEGACRRAAVRRLTVFGSALTEAFDPERSDVNFVVEFGPTAEEDLFGAYFGLREELASILGRPVDLLMEGATSNPYLLAAIDASHRDLYVAS